jgi:hypothetical protein
MRINEIISEDITPGDLNQVETFVDKLWYSLGIDVQFTRHFIERLNDKRNGKPISAAELIRLFKREYNTYGPAIRKLDDRDEAILKDLTTRLNLPFVIKDTENGKTLIAKTIMRKTDFKSPDHEFTVENVSDKASVKNIVDILTTELPTLYRALTRLAENYYDNHGELGRGFRFVAGGARSKWYHAVFFNHLKPALYKLSETLPSGLQNEMHEFLNNELEYGGFSYIEQYLPPLLQNISKVTNDIKLSAAANSASKLISAYYRFLLDLENGDDSEDDEPQIKPAKTVNSVSQQNASVEKIINDTLARIDKKQAGEIRNILAKSDNKLAVLQKEFTKRNIKLSESAKYQINNILFTLKDNNMRLDEIALTEGERQDKAIEIFNRFLPKRTEANDKAFRRHVLDTIMSELGVNIAGAAGLYNYARIKANLPDLGRDATRAAAGKAPVVRTPGATKVKQLDLFGNPNTNIDPRQGDLF